MSEMLKESTKLEATNDPMSNIKLAERFDREVNGGDWNRVVEGLEDDQTGLTEVERIALLSDMLKVMQ